jgi:lipopolysaccharide/colanic/teichoic acid biosynthesis glycosyltransferase
LYFGKRIFDLFFASVALILSAPIIVIAILAIKLESRGNSVYKQRRVGRDGEYFELFKLRTMVIGAENLGAGLAVDQGDARITPIGKILRRTSIDELPNLVNVLKGEMSIVGPRPTVQQQVDKYTQRQRGRLKTKPGIAGWAQLHGRATLPWHKRIELDLWYVDNASLKLDFKILRATLTQVVRGDGIYRGKTGGWRDDLQESKSTASNECQDSAIDMSRR